MKKYILIISLLMAFGLVITTLSSCQWGRGNNTSNNRDKDLGDKKKDDDKKSGRGTRIGGGDCQGDNDCEEKCDDLFSSRSNQRDCYELSVNEVDGMDLAFNEDDGLLAEPDIDDLDDIHPSDLENALKIDDGIWSELIKDYRANEAKEVLYWMASDSDIFDKIGSSLDQDDEEDLLRELLEAFKNNNKVISALTSKLDSDEDEENFIYLANDLGNNQAVKLAHAIAEEDCLGNRGGVAATKKTLYRKASNSDYEIAACLLGEIYCKEVDHRLVFDDVFGDILDDSNYLEDFIEGGETSSFTDGLDVDDPDDLDDVCDVVCGVGNANGIVSGSNKATVCS